MIVSTVVSINPNVSMTCTGLQAYTAVSTVYTMLMFKHHIIASTYTVFTDHRALNFSNISQILHDVISMECGISIEYFNLGIAHD